MDTMPEWRALVENAARLIIAHREKKFFLFHHNDTDGLSSGAILYTMLERLGIRARGYCLEQPYPELLSFLFEQQIRGEDAVVIFTDFGSGILPNLSTLRRSIASNHSIKILVLDHHAISAVEDADVVVVNPRLCGISGTTECSASAVCCEVAQAVNPDNWDLLPLGVLGALGDLALYKAEPLRGVNGALFAAAEGRGLVKYADGEWYIGQASYPASRLIEQVNALGSFGFFRGGPDVAIKGLLEGFDERYQFRANELLEGFSRELDTFVATSAIRCTPHLSWFSLDTSFEGYGVKTVGLVCEELMRVQRVDPLRYVAGFQRVPDRIPGVGPFACNRVKLSMRVPAPLWDKVTRGEQPGLDQILIPAVRKIGGFIDACHPHAGAAAVPAGREEELLEMIERECAGWKAQ